MRIPPPSAPIGTAISSRSIAVAGDCTYAAMDDGGNAIYVNTAKGPVVAIAALSRWTPRTGSTLSKGTPNRYLQVGRSPSPFAREIAGIDPCPSMEKAVPTVE